jgi:hypothetical protein
MRVFSVDIVHCVDLTALQGCYAETKSSGEILTLEKTYQAG